MTKKTPTAFAPSSDQGEPCAAEHRPDAATVSGPGYSLPAAALKAIVLGIMSILTLALLWFPLQRINCDSEINYNEGWNAYKQATVAQGLPLYGAPPNLLTGPTTYPPVSFHLIHWLAGHRDLVKTGRWVSLISLLATGVFIGLIVRELGASAAIATCSTLLWILGISILLPDRRGMNDPQLLGEALTTAGLYLYVKSRNSTRLLCASALVFCVAGFTKQNLLAFPAAAAVDLLIRSRRRFGIWMGAMIVFAGVLTVLTVAIDGRYFLSHLLFHRAYSLDLALTSVTQYYLVTFQSVVLVALVWTLCRFRSSPLLATAFLTANVLAFLLAGGDGVDLNIFFNAIAAAVMIVGFALSEIERGLERSVLAGECATGIPRVSGSAVSPALMAGLLLFVAMNFPDRLQDDHDEAKLLPSQDAAFRSAAALIQRTPGPAMCENLLLCYRAGKPDAFDAFVTTDELETHRLNADTIPELLRRRQFGSVELDTLPEEADSNTSSPIRRRPRFSAESMDALEQNYNLNMRTPQMLIFVAQ
jgi:hypothetical protein